MGLFFSSTHHATYPHCYRGRCGPPDPGRHRPSADQDELSYNGVGTGYQVKTGVNLGVFVRPGVELTDGIELFGRLGWQRTRATVSLGGESESDSYNDFAYGLGVNVNLTKTSYLQASWMNRLSKDGLTVKGLGIAYGYRF